MSVVRKSRCSATCNRNVKWLIIPSPYLFITLTKTLIFQHFLITWTMGSRRFIIACFLVNLCYVLTFSNVVSDQQGSTWSTINPSGGISQKGSSTETSNENISKTPASNSLVNGTNNETKSSNPSDESSNSGNKKNKDKNGAILRGFSVIMGVTGIVVVYFIIRAVRCVCHHQAPRLMSRS